MNKEAKYIAAIQPKIEEIRRICDREQIPCFMAFGVAKKNDKYKLRGACMLPELYGKDGLNDRRFSDFVLVQNGFTTIPPLNTGEFDPDEIEVGARHISENEDNYLDK